MNLNLITLQMCRKVQYFSWGVVILLLVVIPLLVLPAGVFSERYVGV